MKTFIAATIFLLATYLGQEMLAAWLIFAGVFVALAILAGFCFLVGHVFVEGTKKLMEGGD